MPVDATSQLERGVDAIMDDLRAELEATPEAAEAVAHMHDWPDCSFASLIRDAPELIPEPALTLTFFSLSRPNCGWLAVYDESFELDPNRYLRCGFPLPSHLSPQFPPHRGRWGERFGALYADAGRVFA